MFRSSVAILLVGVGILISIFLMMVLFDHRFHNRSEDSDSIDHLKRKLIIKDSMDYQTNRFRQLEPISCKELINQGSKCGAVLVIMPRCDGYWAVNKRSKNIFNYLMIKDNSHLSGQVYSNPDVIFFCPNSTRDWRTNAAIMNNIRFEPLPFPLSEAHLNRFWFVDFLRVVGNYDWVLRLDADVELMSDGTASITDLISKSESGRDLPLLSSIAWRDYRFRESVIDAVSLITNYTKTHMCHYGFTAPVLSAVLINVQRYREIVSTTISYRQGVAKKVSIERFIAKVKQEYGNEYWLVGMLLRNLLLIL